MRAFVTRFAKFFPVWLLLDIAGIIWSGSHFHLTAESGVGVLLALASLFVSLHGRHSTE